MREAVIMVGDANTAAARPHPHPGFFLVLDGPDGGGKTTQAARLAEWLRACSLDVVCCRDPGGTALGNRLREILLDRSSVAISMRAEMLLYMASRAQLVEDVIAPALAAGRAVVSDRYLLSTIAYQGSAGGLLEEEIAMVGMVATAGLLPDLTLILDVAPDIARVRVGHARDRIEERSRIYREGVRAGYLAAAREGQGPPPPGESSRSASCPYYPAPLVLIDASADQDTVFQRIKSEVARVLALDPRP
jgi:dTMP kinase